jgi:hypothetical protein
VSAKTFPGVFVRRVAPPVLCNLNHPGEGAARDNRCDKATSLSGVESPGMASGRRVILLPEQLHAMALWVDRRSIWQLPILNSEPEGDARGGLT